MIFDTDRTPYRDENTLEGRALRHAQRFLARMLDPEVWAELDDLDIDQEPRIVRERILKRQSESLAKAWSVLVHLNIARSARQVIDSEIGTILIENQRMRETIVDIHTAVEDPGEGVKDFIAVISRVHTLTSLVQSRWADIEVGVSAGRELVND